MNPVTAQEIRNLRKERNLTQAQAAELAYLGHRERWTEYESGKRHMPPLRWALFKQRTEETK